MKFFREMLTFFGKRLEKGREKISAKIWSPVSEVLDPLVASKSFSHLVYFFSRRQTFKQVQRACADHADVRIRLPGKHGHHRNGSRRHPLPVANRVTFGSAGQHNTRELCPRLDDSVDPE